MSTAAPIVCTGHSRPIVDVRFCRTKSDDLDLLISACHDKTSQLRWADDGAWIGTFQGHNGAVWSAALDEPGLRVLTGSADFSVKLWNATTGSEMATFPHAHVVKAVDFSSDGKAFLSAGLEKKAYVYDLEKSERVSTFAHGQQVSKAIWLTENLFLTGAYDGALRIWDVRTGNTESTTTLSGASSKKGVADIELVREQNSVITCMGHKGFIFDLKNPSKHIFEFSTKYELEAASLSSNGKRVVAGGSDLWLHVYDLDISKSELTEVAVHRGHHGPIFCIRWESSGQRFASGSEDGTVRLWTSPSSSA